MQRLEVSGAVRPLYESLGVKGLKMIRCWSLRIRQCVELGRVVAQMLSYGISP